MPHEYVVLLIMGHLWCFWNPLCSATVKRRNRRPGGEMVDTLSSGGSSRKAVPVQVRPRAQTQNEG